MMQNLEKMIELADSEFGAIAKNGKFRSREEIDSVYKLMDISKDALCIMDMEDGYGYSEGPTYYRDGGSSYRRGGGSPYTDGMSYARGRGRNARRDSMGRYSTADGGSYHGGRDSYIDELRAMMQDAPDEQSRQSLQRMIEQMEQR